MWIIKNRKIFYTISALLVAASIAAVSVWGIKFGIDFTGGSILEVEFAEKPEKTALEELVAEQDIELGAFSLRETNETGYILRTKTITDQEKDSLILEMSAFGQVDEKRFNTIGPTLGDELRTRALASMAVVVTLITLFIAYAFRRVSKPVSSWKYGFTAILAFLHDVLMPVGLFSALGYFASVEVDTLFVVAILVVLGYSINDTIVVFDRVRENLEKYPENKRNQNFDKIVGKSLTQTVSRSINTSLTTLITLLAIYLLGGDTTKDFALALIAGIISGTYSSIFFAAPMLVTFHKMQLKKGAKISE